MTYTLLKNSLTHALALSLFSFFILINPIQAESAEINNYIILPDTNFIISPLYQQLSPAEKKDIITVLTVDGGGMHGIIPLQILEALEHETKMPISTLFDVMGGTSTGSIIVSSLALPNKDGNPKFTATDVLASYKTDGQEIFKFNLKHSLSTLFGFYGPVLPRKNINKVMSERFGHVTIKDLLSNIFIPCGLLIDYAPFWFKTHHAKQNENMNFFVKDAVLAATATPDLFTPYLLYNTKKNWSDYGIDAGMFINNPTAQILLDLYLLYPDKKFLIISLGTLQMPESPQLKNPEKFPHTGIINGIFPIIEASTTFSVQLTDMQMNHIAKSENSTLIGYVRMNTIPNQKRTSPFSASKKNINNITNIGADLVKANKDTIKKLSNMLIDIKSQPH